MKRVLAILTLSLTLGSLSSHAYFPVGECFNSQMNFGLGASMGFGAAGMGQDGCYNCGYQFGMSGNTNYLLNSYVPTSVAMANPYGMANGMYGVNAGMRFNPMTGAYLPNGGMGYGAQANVGLNLGQYTPLVLGLLTGGLNVGVGVSGGMYGSNIYNGGRYGYPPQYGPQRPIPYGPYPYSTGIR